MVDKETLKIIKDGLQDRRLYAVSKATGLSYPTLERLLKGDNPNPTLNTVRVVMGYLNKK